MDATVLTAYPKPHLYQGVVNQENNRPQCRKRRGGGGGRGRGGREGEGREEGGREEELMKGRGGKTAVHSVVAGG